MHSNRLSANRLVVGLVIYNAGLGVAACAVASCGASSNAAPVDGGAGPDASGRDAIEMDGDLSTMVATDAGGCIGEDAGVLSLTSDTTPIKFLVAAPNPVVGDWEGQGGYVAQVFYTVNAGVPTYSANLLHAFDQPKDMPVAVLQGTPTGCSTMTLSGAGWTGAIQNGHLTATSGTDSIDLQRTVPTLPTLGAPPPDGGVLLFDGTSFDQWAEIDCVNKNWLAQGGPSRWKIADGAMEVVPGTCSIITKQTFGDCTVHLEFRTVGTPSHSGIYLQAQYQTTILQDYGLFTGDITGNYGNAPVTPDPMAQVKGTAIDPDVRAARPPLEWQTLDIVYQGARFDATTGAKTSMAVETVTLNGVEIFDQLQMDTPGGAAYRAYVAAKGANEPILLEYHGMPVQYRNIWVVAK